MFSRRDRQRRTVVNRIAMTMRPRGPKWSGRGVPAVLLLRWACYQQATPKPSHRQRDRSRVRLGQAKDENLDAETGVGDGNTIPCNRPSANASPSLLATAISADGRTSAALLYDRPDGFVGRLDGAAGTPLKEAG